MFICLFVLLWPWIGTEKIERKKRAQARMIAGKAQLLRVCWYHPFVGWRRLDKGRVKKNGNCHQPSEHGIMEHVSEEGRGKISTEERRLRKDKIDFLAMFWIRSSHATLESRFWIKSSCATCEVHFWTGCFCAARESHFWMGRFCATCESFGWDVSVQPVNHILPVPVMLFRYPLPSQNWPNSITLS